MKKMLERDHQPYHDRAISSELLSNETGTANEDLHVAATLLFCDQELHVQDSYSNAVTVCKKTSSGVPLASR